MPSGRPITRSACLLLAAAACPANAWHLDYSLQAALGHSDNINQSATDPVSQSILIPRLDFDFSEDGAALRARAIGQLEYRDYLGGAFNNDLRGQLSGIATWIILPSRLNFDFEDYASVQPVNQLASNAPNNQQQTNVFTFGPTFNFRLQPTLNGQAELRVSESTASRTRDFDSTRVLAALRALKDLSPLDRLSANAEFQDVHFTHSGSGPDYKRADAYARYQSKLTQLDLDLAAGYTRLNFSQARAHSGLLARAGLTWHATPNHTFGVGYARQFADASQDLIVDPTAWLTRTPGSSIVTGSTPITSQVYLEKRLSASYAYQNERLRVRVEPYRRKLDYVLDPTLNQTARGGIIGASYRARPLWTLAFDAGQETRQYAAISRRDTDRRYDLSFTDQLTPHWSARADLIRNERSSTVSDQRFRENVAFFTVIYKR